MCRYSGSCHCGDIIFRFSADEITDALRCTCSICRRKGAALSNFTIPPDGLEVVAREGTLSSYKFGTKTATHHFCNRCGIFTFVETRLNPGQYRVNLGCIDEVDIFVLPVIVFDGTTI